jgi:hypothetical protein
MILVLQTSGLSVRSKCFRSTYQALDTTVSGGTSLATTAPAPTTES